MVITTQKAAQRFRIPSRTARLVLRNDWEGAEIVVRLDIPVGVFLNIQDLVASDQQLRVFEVFGDKVLSSWNIEDEDGMVLEANGKGMNGIPIQLANLIVEQWVEVSTQPSLPLGGN